MSTYTIVDPPATPTVVTTTPTTYNPCEGCAGPGTTALAVITIILILIIIIIAIVFFFFPSATAVLDIRGINWTVTQGTVIGGTGATGVTGTCGMTGGSPLTDSMITGTNNLYISAKLTGPLNLNLTTSSNNFVGLTVAVKNDSNCGGGSIFLQSGSGAAGGNCTLDPGGLDLTVPPGDFAWLVCTSTTPQTFMRLTWNM
ncbi:MAG TPA: hypothetical protein VKR58_09555 [Aquella sp.]|nr:hypothetical protein [Aquella sp.]